MEMLVIPRKNALSSRMRLKNSSKRGTSGTMSVTEEPCHTTTRMRLDLLARSGLSLAGHNSPGKCEELRIATSERQRKDQL